MFLITFCALFFKSNLLCFICRLLLDARHSKIISGFHNFMNFFQRIIIRLWPYQLDLKKIYFYYLYYFWLEKNKKIYSIEKNMPAIYKWGQHSRKHLLLRCLNHFFKYICGKITTIFNNPSFLLTFFDNRFHSCVSLLSSHV